jgi:hypothetical protein
MSILWRLEVAGSGENVKVIIFTLYLPDHVIYFSMIKSWIMIVFPSANLDRTVYFLSWVALREIYHHSIGLSLIQSVNYEILKEFHSFWVFKV